MCSTPLDGDLTRQVLAEEAGTLAPTHGTYVETDLLTSL
jgi:hypothetical protein